MLATAIGMRVRGHSLKAIGAVIGKCGNHVSLILRNAKVQHPGGSVRGLSPEQIAMTIRMWGEGAIYRVIANATGRNVETISCWCRANVPIIGPRGTVVKPTRKIRVCKPRVRVAQVVTKQVRPPVQAPVAPAVQRIRNPISPCLPVAALYRVPPAPVVRQAAPRPVSEVARRLACERSFINEAAHDRFCARCRVTPRVPFELSDDGRRVAVHG